jgi:hypothetical protein
MDIDAQDSKAPKLSNAYLSGYFGKLTNGKNGMSKIGKRDGKMNHS